MPQSNMSNTNTNSSFKSSRDMPQTSVTSSLLISGGGINNSYGPKKITIYKILGLLLLSLYLEHYKK